MTLRPEPGEEPGVPAESPPLREAFADIEPPLSRAAGANLGLLFDLLVQWRGAGITGFRSADLLARYYFREALDLRPFVSGCARVLDVGSGSGTPALPLATVLDDQEWTLLEPRRASAGFLELAVERLGLASRVRVVRRRLDDYLESEDGISTAARVSAVTLRAVRLRAAEWSALAGLLPTGATVIWPTSREARLRADLPPGLYDEELRPADRGIVWVGRPLRPDEESSPDVSRETSPGARRP